MPTNSRAQDERAVVYPFGGGPSDIPVEYLWDSAYHNNADQKLALGTPIVTWDGRVYRYVKCLDGQAMAIGEIMRSELATLKTYAAETAVAYDPSLLQLTFPNVATTAAIMKMMIGADLVLQKTAAGESRKITSAVASGAGTRVGIDRPLSATPAVTDDFLVWAQYVGRRAAAATDPLLGVASVGAISAGNYGWVQTKGWCEKIIGGAAVVQGVSLETDGTGRAITAATAAGAFLLPKLVGVAMSTCGAANDYFAAVLRME